MVWAEPSIEHAAALMRRVFENPAERAAKGARAASDIRAWFSHAAVGALIRKRLAEIERDRPVPIKRLDSPPEGVATVALSAEELDMSLSQHQQAIGSLEWSRTRDKATPFQTVKGLGTSLRVLARVVVQGRINERQQWINTATFNEINTLVREVSNLKQRASESHERGQEG